MDLMAWDDQTQMITMLGQFHRRKPKVRKFKEEAHYRLKMIKRLWDEVSERKSTREETKALKIGDLKKHHIAFWVNFWIICTCFQILKKTKYIKCKFNNKWVSNDLEIKLKSISYHICQGFGSHLWS